jgi:hypothetical protein
MRAPRRHRPRKDERLVPGPEIDLGAMAGKVTYVISAEHKDYLTSAGPGNLRSDASACPRGLNLDEVASWLREAVSEGCVSAALEGDFPRYAWNELAIKSTRLASVTQDSGNTKGTQSKTMKLRAGYDDYRLRCKY